MKKPLREEGRLVERTNVGDVDLVDQQDHVVLVDEGKEVGRSVEQVLDARGGIDEHMALPWAWWPNPLDTNPTT